MLHYKAILPWLLTWSGSKLPSKKLNIGRGEKLKKTVLNRGILTLENVGTAVKYCNIFITLAKAYLDLGKK